MQGGIYTQVHKAVRDGILKKPKVCPLCMGARSKRVGSRRITAHHQDYSKPLDVIWLCSGCHRYLHSVRVF